MFCFNSIPFQLNSNAKFNSNWEKEKKISHKYYLIDKCRAERHVLQFEVRPRALSSNEWYHKVGYVYILNYDAIFGETLKGGK